MRCSIGNVGELGRRVVRVVGIDRVAVGVAVDMQHAELGPFARCGPDQRHGDRAVAAEADRGRVRRDDAESRFLDAREGIDDPARRQHDIAAVDKPERGTHVEVGDLGLIGAHQTRCSRIDAGPWREPMRNGCVPQSKGTPRIAAFAPVAESAKGAPMKPPPAWKSSAVASSWMVFFMVLWPACRWSGSRRPPAHGPCATATSSSTRMCSSGPPMLNGVQAEDHASARRTSGTSRASEAPTRMLTAGRSPKHLLGGIATVARTISWPGSVKFGSKRRSDPPGRRLRAGRARRASASITASSVMPTGRRISAAALARAGTRLGETPPAIVPMLTVTRRERLGLPCAGQRLGDGLRGRDGLASRFWRARRAAPRASSRDRARRAAGRWRSRPCAHERRAPGCPSPRSRSRAGPSRRSGRPAASRRRRRYWRRPSPPARARAGSRCRASPCSPHRRQASGRSRRSRRRGARPARDAARIEQAMPPFMSETPRP